MKNNEVYICVKKYLNVDNQKFKKNSLYIIDYETPNRIYFRDYYYPQYVNFNKHIPVQIFCDYFMNYEKYLRKKKLKKLK